MRKDGVVNGWWRCFNGGIRHGLGRRKQADATWKDIGLQQRSANWCLQTRQNPMRKIAKQVTVTTANTDHNVLHSTTEVLRTLSLVVYINLALFPPVLSVKNYYGNCFGSYSWTYWIVHGYIGLERYLTDLTTSCTLVLSTKSILYSSCCSLQTSRCYFQPFHCFLELGRTP